MGMVVQHMPSTQFALDKQGNSLSKLKKASERLSSGYRINRAADDAAGLAVSEKLRSIRRGLRQGLRNIEDGIGYLRTVEGASQEIHHMLDRLKEIAVQAVNGNYDDDIDRQAMDLEYQQILDEIDQITSNSDFNGVPLFEKHLSAYEYNEGDICHDSDIAIDSKNDELVIGYTIDGVEQEFTVNIPHGSYSVEELADQIDSIMYYDAPELIIGVNTENQLTMQTEGGTVDHISGSGASLFYNTVIGSKDGQLLGVTFFKKETTELEIISGENDEISFRLGNDEQLYTITLDSGYYTHSQLIDALNAKFAQANLPAEVKAVPQKNASGYNIVGFASEATITGLEGNFLKIEESLKIEEIYHSPLYDICKYCEIDNTAARLTGEKRIPNNLLITRDRNDYFVLHLKYYDDDASQNSASIRINLLDATENSKTYAAPADLISVIQKQLDDAGYPFDASINSKGGIEITSRQFGSKCSVELDRNDVPSRHMRFDLFDVGSCTHLTPSVTTSSYNKAYFEAEKIIEEPVLITSAENTLSFDIVVTDNTTINQQKTTRRVDVVIPDGTYATTQDLVQTMNDYLDNNYADIADKLQFSIDYTGTLKLYSEGTNSCTIKSIDIDPASSAYKELIGGTYYTSNIAGGGKGDEITYSSSSTSLPGGGNNVTDSAGTSTPATKEYKDIGSPVAQQSDTYIEYKNLSQPTPVNGTTLKDYSQGDPEGTVIGTTPAKFTLSNVLSMFSVPGISENDLDLSFSLTNENGFDDFTITIPKGSTATEAKNIIANAVSGKVKVTSSGNNLTFTSVGSGEEYKFAGIGGTLLQYAVKSSLADEAGAVVDKANNMVYKPSELKVNNALSRLPYTADSSNDRLVMTAGMHSYDLRLAHKTYNTLTELADEINAQFSAADNGTPATSVAVGSDGKSLIFTGPLKENGIIEIDGLSTCGIGYTIDDSQTANPNYNPATGNVETPATIRAEGIDTHFPKTVDSTNNTVTLDYTSPDPLDSTKTVTETLTITIPPATYNNATEFTNAINTAISSDPALNGKIAASYSASGSKKGLTFTTVNKGKGYRLSNMGGTFGAENYISKANPSVGTLDPDANVIRIAATVYNDRYNTLFEGDGLEITADNKHAALVINGTLYEFDITEGVYQGAAGRADLTRQLGDALAGADVTVTDSGTTLEIVTNQGGKDKSIKLSSANTSPYFMEAQSVDPPTSYDRSYTRCNLLGQMNCSNVEIKDYNNTMSFDFTQNGSTTTVNVEVPAGTYNAQTLAQAIQDSINKTLPAGRLEVYTNTGNNIGIRSGLITPLCSITNFKGPLFDNVFENLSYYPVRSAEAVAGKSSSSSITYIVGRNSLAAETAEEIAAGTNVIIYPDLNDQLIFNLQYNGNKYKIELKIPVGQYSPQSLAEAIRDAGRAKLNAMTDSNGKPFPQDAFNATIGLGQLGLADSNMAISSSDKLVLSFDVPDDGSVDDMRCIIDGVRGNAAYRIFYEATQSPTPSKVIGKADLSNGIEIIAGENDTLSFKMDGTDCTVTIPEGTYTCDQLYEYLNQQYEQMGSMVRCTNMNGHLMFYTTENGNYDIDVFTGNASDDLFYGGQSREKDTEIGIHTGRRTDTYIWYLRTRVDDHLMRINTTGVTTASRAAKALDRIDGAVNYLSRWRALSGAYENRSRHEYERNQEYVANLEEADSTLRDADIPKEVSELAKQQILIQAQNAMIQQGKQQHSSIMDVLA